MGMVPSRNVEKMIITPVFKKTAHLLK